MEDKQSIKICLQGIGIVFSLVLVNDIVNERWFDAGLMLGVIAIALVVVAKMSKVE